MKLWKNSLKIFEKLENSLKNLRKLWKILRKIMKNVRNYEKIMKKYWKILQITRKIVRCDEKSEIWWKMKKFHEPSDLRNPPTKWQRCRSTRTERFSCLKSWFDGIFVKIPSLRSLWKTENSLPLLLYNFFSQINLH